LSNLHQKDGQELRRGNNSIIHSEICTSKIKKEFNRNNDLNEEKIDGNTIIKELCTGTRRIY